MRTRAVSPPKDHGRLLDAAKTQKEFDFRDAEGTLVGIYSPAFSGAFSVPPAIISTFSPRTAAKAATCWRLLSPPRSCAPRSSATTISRCREFEDFLEADLSKDMSAENSAGLVKPVGATRMSHQKNDTLKGTGTLKNGAEVVVRTLEARGVQYVVRFAWREDRQCLRCAVDSSIKTVVCRHEQNAAFIAGGIGRMTGKAGVAIATSGPACQTSPPAWRPRIPREIPSWRSAARWRARTR